MTIQFQASYCLKMLELIETYERLPNAAKINLQLRNLKDLTQMMALLSRFRNLTQLSLHGNQIKSLPYLDSLKKLKHLDISNNPIKIDSSLLDRLFQISSLESLVINANEEEIKTIIQHLPKLQSINGSVINRQFIKKTKLEEEKDKLQTKLNEELTKMRETYYRFSSALETGGYEIGNRQDVLKKEDEFTFIYKDIQEEMLYFYEGLKDRVSLQGVFAYCKNKLTVILDNLIIRILDQIGNDQIVKVYEQVAKIKSQNFDMLLRIIMNISYQRHMNEQLDNENNRFRKETLYLNQIFRLKKEIAALKQERNSVDRVVAKEDQIKRIYSGQSQPRTPTSKARTPKAANDQILKKIPSKSSIQSDIKLNPLNRSPSKVLNKSPSKVLNKSPSKVLNRAPSGALSKAPSKSKFIRVEEPQSKETVRSKTSRPNQSSKVSSLEQLLSLMQEIMAEKRKYNNKHLQKNQDYQTTQQFLFSFFSRKYGLKQIALDWSLSIIKSIQRFCRESIEVEVFGKILKNKLYEQYYDQCKQFKSIVWSTLKRQKVGESLRQGDFRRLFLYFFSYENKETIDQLIKATSFPLAIEQFAYFIQSYKLAFEQKHMKKFISLFQRLDGDNNGYLTQSQCMHLYKELIRDKQLQKDKQQVMIQSFRNNLQSTRKDRFIFSQVFYMIHTIL